MENKKAIQKVTSLILQTTDITTWEQEKILIKNIIQEHINNAYMIDQRYYKEYINLYHDMLIIVNQL